MYLPVFLFVLIVGNIVSADKVLMVLPLGAPSMKNLFAPIANKLVEDGDEVTIVSMYKSGEGKPTAYKDVIAMEAKNYTKKIYDDFNPFQLGKNQEKGNANSQILNRIVKLMPLLCEIFLNDNAVQEAFNSKPDLIMLPALMNECGLILVKKFEVPFIYVTTSGLTPWTSDLVGNPEHPAYVPNQYLSFTDEMNIWQKTINTLMRIVGPIIRKRYILDRLDAVAEKYLHISTSLSEVEKNVSMVFVNSHVSLGFPRPLQPNVIEIGGMHCKPSNELAETDPELSSFLDSSENGVVLLSLGSQIKSSEMPENVRDMFVNAFSQLPYDVVWKWEGERPLNLTDNVLIRSWIPQQDVLGHPSVKAFFSHGGLFSTQEAVYHGVPLIGLPFFSDQHMNVKQAENLGIAFGLDAGTLTEEKIIYAITKVIEDASFRRNVKQRSTIMRDQLNHPLDRAFYWTKYVLRHKGAYHLRSAAASMTTSEFLLLDVISFISIILTVFILFLYMFFRFAWRFSQSIYYRILKKVIFQFKTHTD